MPGPANESCTPRLSGVQRGTARERCWLAQTFDGAGRSSCSKLGSLEARNTHAQFRALSGVPQRSQDGTSPLDRHDHMTRETPATRHQTRQQGRGGVSTRQTLPLSPVSSQNRPQTPLHRTDRTWIARFGLGQRPPAVKWSVASFGGRTLADAPWRHSDQRRRPPCREAAVSTSDGFIRAPAHTATKINRKREGAN